MNISSSNLLHFTNSFGNLNSILRGKSFHPQFCLETHDNLHPNLEVYYPMVCFCDIPLSKIDKHIATYGGYGIALRREWGLTAQLNPVLYPNKNSAMSNMIANGLAVSATDTGVASIIKPLLTMTKTRIGKMYRHQRGGYIENVNFYDEREWRYVPYSFEPWFELKTDNLKHEDIKEHNSRLLDHKLAFDVTDVAYLIVQKREEVLNISTAFRGVSILVWNEIRHDI